MIEKNRNKSILLSKHGFKYGGCQMCRNVKIHHFASDASMVFVYGFSRSAKYTLRRWMHKK